jgi:hypothetical protein
VRWAFKEWAVIIDALGRGEQIIILRKGGLREARGGFRVEHAEFWLFPTYFHQQRASVLPRAQRRFDEIASGFSKANVRLQFYARMEEWRRLDSLAAAQRLRGQHIWREDVIAERFDWGREKQIFALALRVFRLREPVELPMRPAYAGCKSWVELKHDPSTEFAAPVLDERCFADKLRRFRAQLDVAASFVG